MTCVGRALVLAFVVTLLAACGGGAEPRPKPTQNAERAQAADAFAKAYATFRADFAAGTALGEDDGLENATRSVRAIRAAYFDLDTATRKIEMPDDVAPHVNAMLGAIGDLIATLDKQAAVTTSESFEAAKPASSAALQQADDAIQVVVDALGAGTDADSGAGTSGTTKQRRLVVDYVSAGSVDDATAWVADLLGVGAAHANRETPSEDMGVVVAWRAAFPVVLGDSGVVGYEREASENGISGFAVLPKDETKEASRANPYYLAFAVRDAAGRCAGGVLSGFPDPTDERPVRMEPGTRCSGAAVAMKAGY
ncbi:MAG: hypothetical protein ACRDOT_02835 [Aeromicrobium sp.]